jgi:hypothetical protein
MKTVPAFYFDADILGGIVREHGSTFKVSQPFPHVVVDDFLPVDVAGLLAAEFPPWDYPGWREWGPGPTRNKLDRRRDKLGMSEEHHFGCFTRHFMLQLCSATFITFLRNLTGIPGLLADPTFTGCGLHSTGPEGYLLIHTDLNRHPYGKPFHQMLNIIIFLNKGWRPEYGGELEFWSRDARSRVKQVSPIFNRFVAFETHSYSYHGHPNPVACPQDQRRNSLASYYYVVNREVTQDYRGFEARAKWIGVSR